MEDNKELIEAYDIQINHKWKRVSNLKNYSKSCKIGAIAAGIVTTGFAIIGTKAALQMINSIQKAMSFGIIGVVTIVGCVVMGTLIKEKKEYEDEAQSVLDDIEDLEEKKRKLC